MPRRAAASQDLGGVWGRHVPQAPFYRGRHELQAPSRRQVNCLFLAYLSVIFVSIDVKKTRVTDIFDPRAF